MALNDKKGTLVTVFRTDGTFTATRTYAKKKLFEPDTMTSSGSWSYGRGYLTARISGTTERSMLGYTFNGRLQSIGDATMVATDPDGAASDAPAVAVSVQRMEWRVASGERWEADGVASGEWREMGGWARHSSDRLPGRRGFPGARGSLRASLPVAFAQESAKRPGLTDRPSSSSSSRVRQ